MVSIYEDFGYGLSPDTLYNAIKQAGFDGISLLWRESFGDTNNAPPLLAQKAGLCVEYIHMPFNVDPNDLWRDNLNGTDVARKFGQWIQDCHRFQVPALVVHLINGYEVPQLNQIGLSRVMQIIETAEKYNINLAFENQQNTDVLDLVFENINSPRAGFCYDSGHQNCFTPNKDVLQMYGTRLMVLHLHDNNGVVTGTPVDDGHLLPCDGNMGWRKIMGDIRAFGYTGSVSLEVMNRGYEKLPVEEFLQLAYNRAKKLEELC